MQYRKLVLLLLASLFIFSLLFWSIHLTPLFALRIPSVYAQAVFDQQCQTPYATIWALRQAERNGHLMELGCFDEATGNMIFEGSVYTSQNPGALQAAVNSLPQTGPLTGGVVYLPTNSIYVITSTLSLGSATATVTLKPAGRVEILCNITVGGIPCIDIWSSSGIDGQVPADNNVIVSSFNSSMNVTNMIQTEPSIAIENVILRNVQVFLLNGGTVSNAMVDFTSAGDSEVYSLWVGDIANTIGVYIHDASPTICLNALNFYDLQVTGQFLTGARPFVLKNTLGCAFGPVNVFGGDISHAGSGQRNIEINGNGHSFGVGASFYGVYSEDFNVNLSTPAVVLLQDVNNFTWIGGQIIRLNGSATEPCFEINNAGSFGGGIVLMTNCTGGTGHNYVLNDDLSTTSLDNSSGFYRYGGNGGNPGALSSNLFATTTNCNVNSVSPAACGAAASGVFVVPTTTTTYTVNTTAVSANSRIILQPITDNSGITGVPTCAAVAVTSSFGPSARVAGTSFTLSLPSTTGTTCWNYWIIN